VVHPEYFIANIGGNRLGRLVTYREELPTRSRGLPVGTWGVFFSVGGAVSYISLLLVVSNFPAVNNYKIFRKVTYHENRGSFIACLLIY